MLVRKKRENLLKKKVISVDPSSGENLQSLGSWIRKIEQSTTSVSLYKTYNKSYFNYKGYTDTGEKNETPDLASQSNRGLPRKIL